MSEAKSDSTVLLSCGHCGASDLSLERHSSIFAGQIYSDRYPEPICRQHHGFKVRCGKCGMQTCWWHYEKEAKEAWNLRVNGGQKVEV